MSFDIGWGNVELKGYGAFHFAGPLECSCIYEGDWRCLEFWRYFGRPDLSVVVYVLVIGDAIESTCLEVQKVILPDTQSISGLWWASQLCPRTIEQEGSVGLYRNVRIIDLNLSVGITNPRRLNLIFIPSVTVKHCIYCTSSP